MKAYLFDFTFPRNGGKLDLVLTKSIMEALETFTPLEQGDIKSITLLGYTVILPLKQGE